MANDRVEDYLKNPQYEHRIVAFCDVLGWRWHIANAKNDPTKIGALRRQILLVQRVIGTKEKIDLRFSSFSDNIVLSGPANEMTIVAFKALLSDYQLYSAAYGFLTRGGITVGEICHDEQVVFGPALNRAFELESTVAKYPRIVFDRNVFFALAKNDGDLIDEDDDCIFLDPFNFKSIDALLKSEPAPGDEGFWNRIGLPKSADQPLPSYRAMESCLLGIRPILRSPLTDKDYQRVAWLYDRIARLLGHPLSRSYPRVNV